MVIRIAARESHIELLVEDNGQGFDPPKFPHGEGLISIRRRVKELSGTVKWDTAPGHGTHFQASLPLHAHRPMLEVFVRTFRLRSWRNR
jgi:signal transduction histidine kinase